MADYTMMLPINKSSNDFGYRILTNMYNDGYNQFIPVYTEPQAISSMLTITFKSGQINRMGLAWDNSLIPHGKVIKNIKLYFYAIGSLSKAVHYKYASFSEGSAIPSNEPYDGTISAGITSGWNTLDLGAPVENSIIISASLNMKTISLYLTDGTFVGYEEVAEMLQMYSHRNPTNKPYVIATYGDVPPEPPTSLYPSGGTEDARNTIKFAWEHNSPTKAMQKSYELQCSINNGSTWTTVTGTTNNQYYDMPAQTLPSTGSVLWRVRTTDINDETSGYSTASFSLGTPPQKAPILVAPVSQYVDELKPITFEWIFSGGSVYDVQAKYDLQYSVDNGANWTTLSATTGDAQRTIEVGILSKGNISWRVRTYNQFNDVSPYSEIKTFTVIGSPSIPLITEISNKARPIIKWQTQEQQLYEIEIVGHYKSKPTPDSITRLFMVPVYLDNGEYTARVRVTNEYGLQSPWAERSFTIDVVKPEQPSITIYNSAFKVSVLTESHALVYRDGELVGETINGLFEDYTGESGKEYQYFFRSIDENDSFADSETKLGKCNLTANTLASIDSPSDFIKLEYGLDEAPSKLKRIGRAATLQYYDGRTYPVAEYSKFKIEDKALTFYLNTRKEVDNLVEIISNDTLIYRDTDGDLIVGSILAIEQRKTMLGGYEVSFTINRTV